MWVVCEWVGGVDLFQMGSIDPRPVDGTRDRAASVCATRPDVPRELALQTRQSLSTKALSLASQGDQNVLRLLQ